MYVTERAEILIEASPRLIWEYVTDPEHWTASNPEEHYGLEYDTPDNRPAEGVTFHQQEEVAEMFANLYGRFTYVDYPHVAVWAGSAYYPVLGGLFTVRIPEAGTLSLEVEDGGTRMSRRLDGFSEFLVGSAPERVFYSRSRRSEPSLRTHQPGTRILPGAAGNRTHRPVRGFIRDRCGRGMILPGVQTGPGEAPGSFLRPYRAPIGTGKVPPISP